MLSIQESRRNTMQTEKLLEDMVPEDYKKGLLAGMVYTVAKSVYDQKGADFFNEHFEDEFLTNILVCVHRFLRKKDTVAYDILEQYGELYDWFVQCRAEFEAKKLKAENQN